MYRWYLQYADLVLSLSGVGVLKSFSRQRGATLLEGLAFLAVASIVLVGAVSSYKSAQSSADTSAIHSQLTAFRDGLTAMSAGQSFYGVQAWSATVATQALNARFTGVNGALPSGLRANGANILTRFGGTVQVDGDAQSFWIRYNNVPRDQCLRAASLTDNGWLGVSINGTWVATTTAPVPVNTATALCNTPAANYLIWRGQ